MHRVKRDLLKFLIGAREAGKTIAGYGAPGKGNTLLNYCGIRTDFLDYTVDRNPYKHGKFLPGTHIPIFPPERIRETRPDYVFILPWNLKDEIMEQLVLHPGVGRAVRRPDPRGAGVCVGGGASGSAGLIFEPTPLPGAFVITPERLHDERGFFARTFCRRDFEAHGLEPRRRAVQHLRQRPARHAARHALPAPAARRGQARSAARRARSTT